MRLLLDAHFSGRRLGPPLRSRGHDVLAADQDPLLRLLADEDLLQRADDERRVLVTANARDFAPIARTWADERRQHAGCLIIVGVRNSDFGAILRVIDAAFTTVPTPEAWRNLALIAGRGPRS